MALLAMVGCEPDQFVSMGDNGPGAAAAVPNAGGTVFNPTTGVREATDPTGNEPQAGVAGSATASVGGAYAGGAYVGGAYAGGAYVGGAYAGGASASSALVAGQKNRAPVSPRLRIP